MANNTFDSSVKVQKAWAKVVSLYKFFVDYLEDYMDGRKYAGISKMKQNEKQK